jgi:hypothetical protein
MAALLSTRFDALITKEATRSSKVVMGNPPAEDLRRPEFAKVSRRGYSRASTTNGMSRIHTVRHETLPEKQFRFSAHNNDGTSYIKRMRRQNEKENINF